MTSHAGLRSSLPCLTFPAMVSHSAGVHLLGLLAEDSPSSLPMWARFDVRDSDVCHRRPSGTAASDSDGGSPSSGHGAGAPARGTARSGPTTGARAAASGPSIVDNAVVPSAPPVKESSRGAAVLLAAMRKDTSGGVRPVAAPVLNDTPVASDPHSHPALGSSSSSSSRGDDSEVVGSAAASDSEDIAVLSAPSKGRRRSAHTAKPRPLS
jgi:hypothetical protein